MLQKLTDVHATKNPGICCYQMQKFFFGPKLECKCFRLGSSLPLLMTNSLSIHVKYQLTPQVKLDTYWSL